jgi:rubrerythrin
LKGEIGAREFYKSLAGSVENYFLKDRVLFLSAEKEKHSQAFEKMFREQFPGQELLLPEKSPAPLIS